MPNHVTTIIEASEEVIAALVSHESFPEATAEDYPYLQPEKVEEYVRKRNAESKATAEEGYVDFNRIIPQPENIEKGNCSGQHEPGVICWYAWNVDNWGTKWGAYSTVVHSPTKVEFETAWSHPVPIMEKLAEMFPDQVIEVWYADEDIGSNLGHYRIVNGEAESVEEFEEGSDEASEFASQIKHGMSYAELRAEWED